MPIGAAIGGAVVAGGASVYAGSKAAKAQTNAANQSAASADRTAAANNALQAQIYQQNAAYLSPYAARGNVAGDSINALLGLPSAPAAAQGTAQYGAPVAVGNSQTEDQWALGAMRALRTEVGPDQWARVNSIQDPSDRLAALEPLMYRRDREVYGNYSSSNPRPAPTLAPAPAAPAITEQPPVTAEAAGNAFNNYLNSTGYQFQMDQGTKAVNQGYAAKSALQSGAAMKALQTYGQNTGASFFNQYLGLLGNQQAAGLSGASAIAGVGSNYANAVGNNNNNASAAAQSAYATQGNAAAGQWGNIAGAIGGVANAFGSSYGPKPTASAGTFDVLNSGLYG